MAKHIVIQKDWMSLRTITEEYADIGEKVLRRFLGHPTHPLPARWVDGKILVNRHDLDQWLRNFPKYEDEAESIASDIMRTLGNEKTS